MTYDHYPWETLSAAPVLPPASRFVKRGMYLVCMECGLTSMYCLCAMRARVTQDESQAAADLEQRARACKGGR